MTKIALPKELERVRDAARRAIGPLKPADRSGRAAPDFLFTAKDTNASRDLPPFYLIYFLLVDLLGFQNLGRFEKLDWSIPVDLDGVAYLIEHRKFGVGVFAGDAPNVEEQAKRIAILVSKGVKVAAPFFRWMADSAVQQSQINIRNVGKKLFGRYVYFRDCFFAAATEASKSKTEHETQQYQLDLPIQVYSFDSSRHFNTTQLVAMLTFPWVHKAQNAGWLAVAAIDAFFSWTEHIFIHLAILQGRIVTGEQVAALAGSEWNAKFKCALNIKDPTAQRHLDELIVLRRQVRNFMAHGAFGKDGQAFSFHSRAGAVPVAFEYTSKTTRFSLTPELAFEDRQAIATIENFIAYLWSAEREPARLFIQEGGDLPLVLPMASDGTYAAAMASVDDMKAFIDRQMKQSDAASNMDWSLMDEF